MVRAISLFRLFLAASLIQPASVLAADISGTLQNTVKSRIINATRIPTQVRFLDFRVGQARRCRPFDPLLNESPDGPCPKPTTTVYPIQYAVEVRETYSNAVQVQRYRAKANCFIASSGGWICYTQGGFQYF